MNQIKIRGIAFIVMGIAFASFYFIGDRGAVWLALGVVFVVLGSARIRSVPRS